MLIRTQAQKKVDWRLVGSMKKRRHLPENLESGVLDFLAAIDKLARPKLEGFERWRRRCGNGFGDLWDGDQLLRLVLLLVCAKGIRVSLLLLLDLSAPRQCLALQRVLPELDRVGCCG